LSHSGFEGASWRTHTAEPLRAIGGTTLRQTVTAFYFKEPRRRPFEYRLTPWVGDDRIQREDG
jgi:hypothetical protein